MKEEDVAGLGVRNEAVEDALRGGLDAIDGAAVPGDDRQVLAGGGVHDVERLDADRGRNMAGFWPMICWMIWSVSRSWRFQ